jgi:uracil-DNA glycosylase
MYQKIPVMVTWHPAYVLYNGGIGSETWKEFLSDVEKFLEATA